MKPLRSRRPQQANHESEDRITLPSLVVKGYCLVLKPFSMPGAHPGGGWGSGRTPQCRGDGVRRGRGQFLALHTALLVWTCHLVHGNHSRCDRHVSRGRIAERADSSRGKATAATQEDLASAFAPDTRQAGDPGHDEGHPKEKAPLIQPVALLRDPPRTPRRRPHSLGPATRAPRPLPPLARSFTVALDGHSGYDSCQACRRGWPQWRSSPASLLVRTSGSASPA